ncbi:hypothetical protein [Iamia sp.]|uniref:hypothetical protein n=1 Tax=Iamia sp. TaxID=2722710 RepID=UPI002C4EECE0|nr:hypothetical protein [Iamia sp.]HXH58648.1 hypothetical protein [Iamia sp.]
MSTRRRSSSLLRLLAVLVAVAGAVVAVPGGGASGQSAPGGVAQPPPPTGCSAPYEPIFASLVASEPEPEGDPVRGEALEVASRPFDTDGDGVTDTLTDLTGGGIRVDRGNGALQVDEQVFFANRFDPADFDGDGGTDLLLGAGAELYLLPGATPSGSATLADDAILLSDSFAGGFPAGDQDGDGTDDLAVTTTDGTELFSGADLAAPGPGGSFTGEPIETFPGQLVGRLPFDPFAPTLVTSTDIAEGGDDVTIIVQGDPVLELTIAGSGLALPPSDGSTTPVVSLHADGGQVWVVLGYVDRTGSRRWVWELTDLCRSGVPAEPAPPAPAPPAPGPPAPPAAPAPAAPPAAPIATDATFTG